MDHRATHPAAEDGLAHCKMDARASVHRAMVVRDEVARDVVDPNAVAHDRENVSRDRGISNGTTGWKDTGGQVRTRRIGLWRTTHGTPVRDGRLIFDVGVS